MNHFLTKLQSIIHSTFLWIKNRFVSFSNHLRQRPKLAVTLVLLSLFFLFGVLTIIQGTEPLNQAASRLSYLTRLELLYTSLVDNTFIGIPAWMFQTYSNLQAMMGFDVFSGFYLLARSVAFESPIALEIAIYLTLFTGTLLLYFLLNRNSLPKYINLLLSIGYGAAIWFASKYLGMEYLSLFVYGPLYGWVMVLFFKQYRFVVSAFLLLLGLHNPLTILPLMIVLALVFIIELFKIKGNSIKIATELGWFLLYIVLGFVIVFIFYYPAISQTTISIYGSGAVRSTFDFLGRTWQVFPTDALFMGIFRFFFYQRFIDFFGNRFVYSIEYWLVIIGFILLSLASLAVFFKSKVNQFFRWIDDKFGDFYHSHKKTLLVLGVFVFTVLFGIQISIILIRNSFYNNFSDDIIQYYSIITDFIGQIKSGSLSWFNLNNYFGASYFSDVYYVPLDIFTLGTFLFSYVMPTELAYSTFELIKIWAGVMVFAYYLTLQGMKPRTVFWMGVVYFVSGGTVSFMAFPVFLSLVFYLPLGLVVIHWFYHGKKWTVPLYALALVLYDFYLGYTALAFVSFMFLIETFKKPDFNLFKFARDGVWFLGLLLLGVVMSGVILIPSIQFIIEDTYRPVGSFQGWSVTILGQNLKLFPPNVYVRIVAKIFTEQKPIGFYGFENHYGLEHVSLYITIVMFAMMNYIYFMKGRIAWVYKIAIPIALLLMVFPIFSYVFSGQFFTTAFGSGHSVFSKEFWAIQDTPYTRWINMLPLVMTMILAHVFDQYGFEKLKTKYLTITTVLSMGALVYVFQYYSKKLATTTHYVSRDVLTIDMILMGVAMVVFILILVFGWMKRPQWMKKLFWVEFIIAFIYLYSGPFAIPNKIDTFQEMRAIDQFLTESISEEEFFRVYVDINRFNVERLNYNRMTTFPTNTEIFHSWTDMETNEISFLLYGVREYQTKNKMNAMALYINHVLGYRYVLVSATRNFNLESDYFTLVNQNQQFRLYEITHSESFQVYESFMTSDLFKVYSNGPNKLAAQRIMLQNVIVKDPIEGVNLIENTTAITGSLQTANATNTISTSTLVDEVGSTRKYYRYSNEDWKIGFSVGAVYIKSVWLSPLNYGRVFMEFYDGTQRECEVVEGLTHQVKCEFWQEPQYIFFEQTDRFQDNLELQYRMEAAIDGAAYLIYNLPSNAFASGQGMLYFALNSGHNFERVFVEDANKVQTEAFEGYYYLNNSSPKRIYVYKTNQMYQEPNLFSMHMRYVYDDLTFYNQNAPSKVSSNQALTIHRGVIRLSYTRTSTTEQDQIVMIPVAYSEEWKIKDKDYQTLSVSGGFLGIVIPHGEADIDITLRFVPKGLSTGFKITLVGILAYGVLFGTPYAYRRVQRKKSSLKEGSTDEETNHHHPVV